MQNTVGILGGGQLGRMTAAAANCLGIRTMVLDRDGCPASQVLPSDMHVSGNFADRKDILRLAERVDVLTVEIEHIDVDSLHAAQLAHPKLRIYPTPNCIAVIQDKYRQKVFLSTEPSPGTPGSTTNAGTSPVPLPEFRDLAAGREHDGIRHAADSGFGFPIMVKAKRLAYDGRGNYVVHSPADIPAAVAALLPNNDSTIAPASGTPSPLYVERMVPFVKELAVMVSVSTSGEICCYSAVETIQENNVCKYVVAPAQIPTEIQHRAISIASNAVQRLASPGIFGVELFLLPDGDVLVNEIAPRPHNSGHYTMDACATSQFEQHLRCILGLPLGATRMLVPNALMINLLGEYKDLDLNERTIRDTCQRALSIDGASVHLYGKKEFKQGRKMGHINVVGQSLREVISSITPALGAIPLAEFNAMGATTATASNISSDAPIVGIIMGSDSDLPTMKPCAEMLKQFGISFEITIVSAHRTPARLVEYSQNVHNRGLRVIIAAAGGAAHLPGMVAAMTPLPVVGVPVALKHLDGVDSLYSIVQMPRGVPVATVAINNSVNAALLTARILGITESRIQQLIVEYREKQEQIVLDKVETLKERGWESYC